jgi:protocatechuate 3,4-dioxygenase, alpha subunit
VAALPTPSQTVGPFFSFVLLDQEQSQLVPPGSAEAIRIGGRILDGAGEPIPDALVELWQADSDGRYGAGFGWGRSGCDADGRYAFVTRKPGPVPGPDGGLQAPHLSVLVFARGLLKPVRTRMYFPDEAANAEDHVLASLPEAERARLVARTGDHALEFDIRLQGGDQTPFFAV